MFDAGCVKDSVWVVAFAQQYAVFREKCLWVRILKLWEDNLYRRSMVFQVVVCVLLLSQKTKYPKPFALAHNAVQAIHCCYVRVLLTAELRPVILLYVREYSLFNQCKSLFEIVKHRVANVEYATGVCFALEWDLLVEYWYLGELLHAS